MRSEISNLVLEEGVGWSIDIANKNGLLDFFNKLSKANLGHYKNMAAKARLLIEEKYDEKIVLRNFQEKMESVMLRA